MSETIDDSVDAYATGLPAQLAALAVGASIIKGDRYDFREIKSSDVLVQLKRKFRNDASAAIARAKKRAGPRADFLAETGDFRTETNDLIVCVVITRTA